MLHRLGCGHRCWFGFGNLHLRHVILIAHHYSQTGLGLLRRFGHHQEIQQQYYKGVEHRRTDYTNYLILGNLFHHFLSGRRVANTILNSFSFAILSTLTISL